MELSIYNKETGLNFSLPTEFFAEVEGNSAEAIKAAILKIFQAELEKVEL